MATAAIVTGASRGIGIETAKVRASRGHLVYGISRTSPQFSHELFAHKSCDISDSGARGLCMDSIIADAQARGATIGALVNNAGYVQPARRRTCRPKWCGSSLRPTSLACCRLAER